MRVVCESVCVSVCVFSPTNAQDGRAIQDEKNVYHIRLKRRISFNSSYPFLSTKNLNLKISTLNKKMKKKSIKDHITLTKTEKRRLDN